MSVGEHIGSPGYWHARMGNLGSELPAWADAFSWLQGSAYLEGLASAMGTVEISAPRPDHVFRPYAEMPPSAVRVVILGQDPYPDPSAACGRAFAVPAGQRVPLSLGNILKLRPRSAGALDPALDAWVQQGVLLLNASPLLYPGSGKQNQPWRAFTEQVLRYLAARHPGVVFVLMGKVALSYRTCLPAGARVVETPHPAARDGSFQRCDIFGQINATLPAETRIDW